jgi:hypothetical protein
MYVIKLSIVTLRQGRTQGGSSGGICPHSTPKKSPLSKKQNRLKKKKDLSSGLESDLDKQNGQNGLIKINCFNIYGQAKWTIVVLNKLF